MGAGGCRNPHEQCMTLSHYDVIIIGAGASGLMAAIHSAKRGRSVLVIDHANRAGKKMLVSGGGKCNFTNRKISYSDYFGRDSLFCKYALKRFPAKAIVSILRAANIETEEREHGRLFCKNGANEIVSYLVDTAKNAGVQFLFNTKIVSVNHSSLFSINCAGQTFYAPCLLIATGGLSWPQLGATSFGYALAEQFGHSIIPLKPALAGFIIPFNSPLLHLQGISLEVQLSIKGKDIIVAEPLLFTHQGISGPAALQGSCFWEKGEALVLNFLPSQDIVLQMHKPENGKCLVKGLLTQILPERLVKAIVPEQLNSRKVAELNKIERKIIAGCIHDYQVVPRDVESFAKAEATLGGVNTGEIDPVSMESRLKKGLFFSGEVIDITGKLGGYNIHWALASGFVAGQNL